VRRKLLLERVRRSWKDGDAKARLCFVEMDVGRVFGGVFEGGGFAFGDAAGNDEVKIRRSVER